MAGDGTKGKQIADRAVVEDKLHLGELVFSLRTGLLAFSATPLLHASTSLTASV